MSITWIETPPLMRPLYHTASRSLPARRGAGRTVHRARIRAPFPGADAARPEPRRDIMTRIVCLIVACLVALPGMARAQAPKEVVIGVLYPLSGPVAQVGIDSVNAVKLATEIINNGGSQLNLPLGKTAGLPGLGGAKIRLVIVDHQGQPDVRQSEAE